MAPDTQQNIIVALYLIILHNFEAILYSLGIIGATIWALYKPTRGNILILWGFIFLIFAFEYDKHILEPLKEQTLNSLITERRSIRIEYIVTKTFTRAVPFALPVLGWTLIISGIFFDKITRFREVVFINS
jgi:hypothetical protein